MDAQLKLEAKRARQREYNRRFRERHPERSREIIKKYQQSHPEIYKKNTQAYRQRCKDKRNTAELDLAAQAK